MADSTTRLSEYSASQASDIQESATHEPEHDYRTIPGGHPSRATAALGMESVDQDANTATLAGHPPDVEPRVREEHLP